MIKNRNNFKILLRLYFAIIHKWQFLSLKFAFNLFLLHSCHDLWDPLLKIFVYQAAQDARPASRNTSH